MLNKLPVRYFVNKGNVITLHIINQYITALHHFDMDVSMWARSGGDLHNENYQTICLLDTLAESTQRIDVRIDVLSKQIYEQCSFNKFKDMKNVKQIRVKLRVESMVYLESRALK